MKNNDSINGIPRFPYELDGVICSVGKIGRLQTLFTRELIPGDSIEMNFSTNLRLSPLRRPMATDFQVDLFAFFHAHWKVYSTIWKTFILEGQDEGQSLTTRTFASGRNECLGQHYNSGDTVPLYITQGYIDIFNRYFKLPGDADVAANVFDSLNHVTDDRQDYGFQCGHLPKNWNRIVLAEVTTADYRVPLTDTNTTLDLLSVSDYQGRLKTERAREWYAAGSGARYADVMRYTYGTDKSEDVDIRPELIAHSTAYLSGFDVNGTDATTLGTVSGKGIGQFNLSFPSRFFGEHGVLWVMCLVRPMPVHQKETNWLPQKSNPTYKEISGDPEIYARQAPITNNISEWIKDSTVTTGSIIPFGQWYREGANRIHQKFSETTGWPFNTTLPTNIDHCKYIYSGQFDSVFASTEMAHWHSNGYANIFAKRVIPPPMVGVFAGVN